MSLDKRDWDDYERLAVKFAEAGFIVSITVCTDKQIRKQIELKKWHAYIEKQNYFKQWYLK